MSSRPHTRSLDHAERWFNDGFAVCRPPSFHESIEVNMTKMSALIQEFRLRGVRITFTQIFVRAAALALRANPALHSMICGAKMYSPTQVDIALSVDADTPLAPVLIIENAENKSLPAIAAEIAEKTPLVQAEHRKMISVLQHWGWLVPSGFLRRQFLRLFYRSFRFRRKGSGTFQVSVIGGVDYAATSAFNGCGVLFAGKVRERAIAVDGKVAICPTVILTCSADHRIWSGCSAARFLQAVKAILERDSSELESLAADGTGCDELQLDSASAIIDRNR